LNILFELFCLFRNYLHKSHDKVSLGIDYNKIKLSIENEIKVSISYERIYNIIIIYLNFLYKKYKFFKLHNELFLRFK
jgi:hypothetical protein